MNRKAIVVSMIVVVIGAPLVYGLYLGFVPLSWGWAGDYYARAGIALDGYDPVAYHTIGEARVGEPGIATRWLNLEWRFISETHRAEFETDPVAFAPQFGGYCAKAVGSGFSGGGNPRVWHLENGRLYFFFSEGAREDWLAELDTGILARSEANWADKRSSF